MLEFVLIMMLMQQKNIDNFLHTCLLNNSGQCYNAGITNPVVGARRSMKAIVSAYSAPCPIQGTGNHTRTGKPVRDKSGKYVPGCAVDPRVIPLGSRVRINGVWYEADDTGGAIKGNRIDLRLASRGECMKFGRKHVRVQIEEARMVKR